MLIKNAVRAPDLESIKYWVFDLDNTLYPHGADLFTQVDHKMGLFIQDMFNISYDEAKKRQKHFFMTRSERLMRHLKNCRVRNLYIQMLQPAMPMMCLHELVFRGNLGIFLIFMMLNFCPSRTSGVIIKWSKNFP